jgi:hypothetical protein
LDDVDQGGGVREVAVMENKLWVRRVGVFVDVIDAAGVEERGATLDTVDFVAFGEEKLGKVGSVLASDSCDKSFLQSSCSP